MKSLSRWHIVVGLTGIAAFLGTGQYMHHALGHLKGLDDGPRMLYRTAHIYLMWASMLNLMLGLYLRPLADRSVGRYLQVAGSVLLLFAPVGIVMSFALESTSAALVRPIGRLGIYAGFAGPLLHFASQMAPRRSALHPPGSALDR